MHITSWKNTPLLMLSPKFLFWQPPPPIIFDVHQMTPSLPAVNLTGPLIKWDDVLVTSPHVSDLTCKPPIQHILTYVVQVEHDRPKSRPCLGRPTEKDTNSHLLCVKLKHIKCVSQEHGLIRCQGNGLSCMLWEMATIYAKWKG